MLVQRKEEGIYERLDLCRFWVLEVSDRPVKRKNCVCRQWTVGTGLYLKVYDVNKML